MSQCDQYDAIMRTTSTTEEDVARSDEGRCERLRSHPRSAAPSRGAPRKLGLRAGYDPTRLNQLVDELEVDAWRERQERLRK